MRARRPFQGAGDTAGNQNSTAGPTRVNANSFKALEFDRILALLLQQAGSAEGRARLEALRPLTEPGPVREALARTSEAVAS